PDPLPLEGEREENGTDADGSTASLAALTGWPVVLVVDVRGQAASAAAVVQGFARHRPGVTITGVVFNRVGGPRHEAVLRAALARHAPDVAVLGCLAADARLALPSRHLGLVQAVEHPDLEAFLDAAAAVVAASVDVERLVALSRPLRLSAEGLPATPLPPPGQRIAVARDQAFAFAYPAVLDGWRTAGAQVSTFSPLADEPPPADADAVILPGGYPELHAGRLAANGRFLAGLRAAAARGAAVLGECGGYMVLGRVLVDAAGTGHAMAGLLPLATSFASRRLHLGYRVAVLAGDGPLGGEGAAFRGHEFHYATILDEGGEDARPLFHISDAGGRSLGTAGLSRGRVAGSFIHLIDRHLIDRHLIDRHLIDRHLIDRHLIDRWGP
ncbi:MAG: cobyrinate a,c-diamide synthase, partial [Alphaproteobacteria bacterium]